MRQWLGRSLARYLGTPGRTAVVGYPSNMALLAATVRPDDLLLVEGSSRMRAVPLSGLAGHPCRICRPASLSGTETLAVCRDAIDRIGLRCDLKNIVDLARYLLPTPPVPVRWRRRLLALGSGDPTRAICSTLIAQAFPSVRYPILPTVETAVANQPDCQDGVSQILHVRHHSLFAPSNVDVLPHFEVIRPTLFKGFDHHTLVWANAPASILARPA